ncbi:MAG: hypothetical protein ACXVYY_05815 [Oryzihumus sp.]
MDPRLVEALEPVLRDARSTVDVVPEFRDRSWVDDPRPTWAGSDPVAPEQLWAEMHAPDGSMWGVWVLADDPPAERVVRAADQFQEWVVEQLWGLERSTSWPECPEHPDTHPLAPLLGDGAPVWACPRSGHVACAIGVLGR